MATNTNWLLGCAQLCSVTKGKVPIFWGVENMIFYHTPHHPHPSFACVDINVIEGRTWRITKICLISKPGKYRCAQLLWEVHFRKYSTFGEISFRLDFGIKITNGHFPFPSLTKLSLLPGLPCGGFVSFSKVILTTVHCFAVKLKSEEMRSSATAIVPLRFIWQRAW